jgi:uncharacterized protein involved in exopolysaccharide biosynthesis
MKILILLFAILFCSCAGLWQHDLQQGYQASLGLQIYSVDGNQFVVQGTSITNYDLYVAAIKKSYAEGKITENLYHVYKVALGF